MHEQNIICSKTHLDGTRYEQTIIYRQILAGHVVGSRPMKRKKKCIKFMIIMISVIILHLSHFIIDGTLFQQAESD